MIDLNTEVSVLTGVVVVSEGVHEHTLGDLTGKLLDDVMFHIHLLTLVACGE